MRRSSRGGRTRGVRRDPPPRPCTTWRPGDRAPPSGPRRAAWSPGSPWAASGRSSGPPPRPTPVRPTPRARPRRSRPPPGSPGGEAAFEPGGRRSRRGPRVPCPRRHRRSSSDVGSARGRSGCWSAGGVTQNPIVGGPRRVDGEASTACSRPRGPPPTGGSGALFDPVWIRSRNEFCYSSGDGALRPPPCGAGGASLARGAGQSEGMGAMGLMDKVKAQAEVGTGQGQRGRQGRPGEAGRRPRPSTRPTACSATSGPPLYADHMGRGGADATQPTPSASWPSSRPTRPSTGPIDS